MAVLNRQLNEAELAAVDAVITNRSDHAALIRLAGNKFHLVEDLIDTAVGKHNRLLGNRDYFLHVVWPKMAEDMDFAQICQAFMALHIAWFTEMCASTIETLLEVAVSKFDGIEDGVNMQREQLGYILLTTNPSNQVAQAMLATTLAVRINWQSYGVSAAATAASITMAYEHLRAGHTSVSLSGKEISFNYRNVVDAWFELIRNTASR